jgi:hypothetical protein
MAFTFEPVSIRRQARPRTTFEIARERMVATLRAELDRFIRERRNTRHIKKLSFSETVFVIRFGAIEAIQAKVTGERGEPLRREAEQLFSAILKKGVIDKPFRRAFKIGIARLDAMRKRRRAKRG